MRRKASPPLAAVIAQHKAIRAVIDKEDDEDKVARLADAEDALMLSLAQSHSASDEEFFAKAAYLLQAAAAEPTMQDAFGAVPDRGPPASRAT
jgi:hypothetical protein